MDGLGNRITDTPKLAGMPIVSQEECLRSKMDFVFLTSNRTFCAGFRNGNFVEIFSCRKILKIIFFL